MPKIRSFALMPEHQPDAYINVTPPVSGALNELIDATNVRLISLAAAVKWTVQPNPLEAHFDVDGVTFTVTQANPVSDQWYFVYINPKYAEAFFNAVAGGTSDVYRAYLFEARHLSVDLEITGGTVSNLYGRAKYAIY